MPALLLLQIAVLGIICVFPVFASAQLLMCLTPEELVAGNYRLQKPVGINEGQIPEDSHLLWLHLSEQKREIFALTREFRFEQDGLMISPVFICDENRPAFYQLPLYSVACPRIKGGPVLIALSSLDLLQAKIVENPGGIFEEDTIQRPTGWLSLIYWTDSCVAFRRLDFPCVQERLYPDILYHNFWTGRRPNPKNLELPYECSARRTIQHMKPITPDSN